MFTEMTAHLRGHIDVEIPADQPAHQLNVNHSVNLNLKK